jgi:two-component system LytT family response regulator
VYVDIHTGNETVAHRDTLARLAERLPADHFIRVHRSAIVNLAHVARVEQGRGGTCAVHMKSGARIPVSRTYRRALTMGPG